MATFLGFVLPLIIQDQKPVTTICEDKALRLFGVHGVGNRQIVRLSGLDDVKKFNDPSPRPILIYQFHLLEGIE